MYRSDLPLEAIEILDLAGCVIEVMVRASPSLSLSLASTSRSVPAAQRTMLASLTATGALLTGAGGVVLLMVTATDAVAAPPRPSLMLYVNASVAPPQVDAFGV